jgi:plasmid stability protein
MEALLQRIAERVGVSDAGTEAHGRSADSEHRAILAAALMSPSRRHLAELVGSMPDVGLDTDFER